MFLILLQRLSYNISFPPRVTGKCDIMKSSLCKTNINWVLHSNVKFTVIGEYKIYLRMIRSAKEFSNWKNFKKWLNKDGDNLWQVDFNFIIFTSFNFEQGRLKRGGQPLHWRQVESNLPTSAGLGLQFVV